MSKSSSESTILRLEAAAARRLCRGDVADMVAWCQCCCRKQRRLWHYCCLQSLAKLSKQTPAPPSTDSARSLKGRPRLETCLPWSYIAQRQPQIFRSYSRFDMQFPTAFKHESSLPKLDVTLMLLVHPFQQQSERQMLGVIMPLHTQVTG
jgi:hypothetical protein